MSDVLLREEERREETAVYRILVDSFCCSGDGERRVETEVAGWDECHSQHTCEGGEGSDGFSGTHGEEERVGWEADEGVEVEGRSGERPVVGGV